MNNIVVSIIGAPSTGKTTLAKKVSSELGLVYVPEPARLLLSHSNVVWDQLTVCRMLYHMTKQAMRKAERESLLGVFVDGPPISILIWTALREPQSMDAVVRYINEHPIYCDLTLYSPLTEDTKMVYDGVRYDSLAERHTVDALFQLVRTSNSFHPVATLRGTLDQRTAAAQLSVSDLIYDAQHIVEPSRTPRWVFIPRTGELSGDDL